MLSYKAKLYILIIRPAKFGFKDGTVLANMAECSMGKSYNEYFLQSMRKLIEPEVDEVMKTLDLGYSDDIMSYIYLQQIHNEDIKGIFEHPDNWKSLTRIEKSNLLLRANFLKILAVIDF